MEVSCHLHHSPELHLIGCVPGIEQRLIPRNEWIERFKIGRCYKFCSEESDREDIRRVVPDLPHLGHRVDALILLSHLDEKVSAS